MTRSDVALAVALGAIFGLVAVAWLLFAAPGSLDWLPELGLAPAVVVVVAVGLGFVKAAAR